MSVLWPLTSPKLKKKQNKPKNGKDSSIRPFIPNDYYFCYIYDKNLKFPNIDIYGVIYPDKRTIFVVPVFCSKDLFCYKLCIPLSCVPKSEQQEKSILRSDKIDGYLIQKDYNVFFLDRTVFKQWLKPKVDNNTYEIFLKKNVLYVSIEFSCLVSILKSL